MGLLPTQMTPPTTNLADLTILLYGPSKFGKSTLCSQAEGALFLATEAGLKSLKRFETPIHSWEKMLAACAEIDQGKHHFKTVIIDTVDNAYRMCVEHVLGKQKVEHESDLAYGKGYALVNNEFHRVLTKLSHLPYGLVLVSHSQEKEIETRTGKVTRIVPTLPDKARKLVLGMVDMILFCDFETEPATGGRPAVVRRVLRTKPSRHFDAGDRTGRLPEVVPFSYTVFAEAFRASTTRRAALAGTGPDAQDPVPFPGSDEPDHNDAEVNAADGEKNTGAGAPGDAPSSEAPGAGAIEAGAGAAGPELGSGENAGTKDGSHSPEGTPSGASAPEASTTSAGSASPGTAATPAAQATRASGGTGASSTSAAGGTPAQRDGRTAARAATGPSASSAASTAASRPARTPDSTPRK